MNTKIARALSLLFQLSDEDRTFVFRLWNMSEVERESLIEALQPDKSTTKKAGKKSSMSKSSQSSSKSLRASGIHAQLKERREAATKDITGESKEPDIFDAIAERRLQTCTTCGGYEDFMDHHQPSPHYHPFRPVAPPAPAPSPVNGGVGSTTVSSETGKADAGTVAHGVSGGN